MDGAFEGEETKLGLRVQWHNYAAIACDEEWSGVLLQNGVVDMFSLLRLSNLGFKVVMLLLYKAELFNLF
ncbi:hypothetical protein WN943_024141 [Citrus x changshan-huyou]